MSVTNTSGIDNPTATAASNYASRNWLVVPIHAFENGKCGCSKGTKCTSPGKHPMTKSGLEDATTIASQIGKWWSNAPTANVALRTGTVSGFWVLDADGAEGVEAVEKLEKVFGALPVTPTVRTGGGGRHYYFKSPLAVKISNTTRLGGRPVDVRGEGGYVLAPPSSHASGNNYVWEVSPDKAPVAAAPNWLIELVTKKKPWPVEVTPQPGDFTSSTIGASTPTPTVVPRLFHIGEDLDLVTAEPSEQGYRHVKLVRLVGAHVGRGESPEEILEQALAYGATCAPPMDELEIKRVVNDLVKKQATASQASDAWEAPVPFTDFELPNFPTKTLPPWLGGYVDAVALATQTPPDMVAMLALSTLAASLAKKVEVSVNEGYREPVNLFTGTALPPGSRKSAVYTEVTAPLVEYEASEIRRLTPIIAEEQTRLEIRQKHHAKMKEDVLKAKPEEYDAALRMAATTAGQLTGELVPTLPRLIASDTTPERLATMLQEQNGRMAVMSPEGDVFDLMAGRYGSKGAANFGVYLNGHAGDDLRVDRVNRPAEYVRRPALTLGLVVQPDVIHGLADKPGFRGRGLLGRFLYCLPASLVGRRKVDPPPVPSVLRTRYRHILLQLLQLRCIKDAQLAEQPYLLQLSPAARQVYLAFSSRIEPMLAETGELGCIADWAGKLVGAVVRIAGLLHMAEHVNEPTPWSLPITQSTMEHAVEIGEYLIPHAKAAFAQMGADPVLEDSKFVWSWITRKEFSEVSEREVFEGTKGRFKRMELLRPAFQALINHGYLRRKEATNSGRPGRKPSPVYEVNPVCLTQNSHNGSPGLQFANHATIVPTVNGWGAEEGAPSSNHSANCADNANASTLPAEGEQPEVDSQSPLEFCELCE